MFTTHECKYCIVNKDEQLKYSDEIISSSETISSHTVSKFPKQATFLHPNSHISQRYQEEQNEMKPILNSAQLG